MPEPKSTAGRSVATMSDQEADAIYAFGANQLRDGMTAAQVRQSLRDKGLDAHSANTIVQELQEAKAQLIREANQHVAKVNQNAGTRNMAIGGLWCLGGTLVTVITYLAAAGGGGTYVVAWGAIIFGAFQFIRGLVQVSQK